MVKLGTHMASITGGKMKQTDKEYETFKVTMKIVLGLTLVMMLLAFGVE